METTSYFQYINTLQRVNADNAYLKRLHASVQAIRPDCALGPYAL
jgi:hypothetical protein